MKKVARWLSKPKFSVTEVLLAAGVIELVRHEYLVAAAIWTGAVMLADMLISTCGEKDDQ